MDLENCDDPIRIASVALSELRIGSTTGGIDDAVKAAIWAYLEDVAYPKRRDPSGTLFYAEMCSAPLNDVQGCEQCIARWYFFSG
ncbi:MAG: hypothetical protein ACKV0T_24380 [Planctomycetales bacterium]